MHIVCTTPPSVTNLLILNVSGVLSSSYQAQRPRKIELKNSTTEPDIRLQKGTYFCQILLRVSVSSVVHILIVTFASLVNWERHRKANRMKHTFQSFSGIRASQHHRKNLNNLLRWMSLCRRLLQRIYSQERRTLHQTEK